MTGHDLLWALQTLTPEMLSLPVVCRGGYVWFEAHAMILAPPGASVAAAGELIVASDYSASQDARGVVLIHPNDMGQPAARSDPPESQHGEPK